MDDDTSRYDTVTVDGDKVHHHRTRRRLTQQRLAEASGRSRGWISVIEGNDRASVSRTTAQSLAAALQVDLEELLSNLSGHDDPASSLASDDTSLGDFTFSTPTAVSVDRPAEDSELEAILAELKHLERRVQRLLAARRRKR